MEPDGVSDLPTQGGAGRARAGCLRQQFRYARFAMLAERALRAFWPVWTIAALAGALALSGSLPRLGGWLHAAALVVLAALLALACTRAVRVWAFPRPREVRARLDRGAPGRPAATLADRQALGRGDPFAEQIWALHRHRAAIEAAQLRPPAPDLRLARFDPFALRAAALLLLGAAALHAGGDWGTRLGQALVPDFSASAVVGPPVRIDAWTEAPPYTGEAPVWLTERPDAAEGIEVPAGTRLQLRAWGAAHPPRIRQLQAGQTVHDAPLEQGAEGGHAASVLLEADRIVEIRTRDALLARWELRVRPDLPPAIAFAAPPQTTRSDALTFSYRVEDDYGAARAWATITPAKATGRRPLFASEPVDLPLALPLAGFRAGIRAGALAGEEDGARGSEEFVIRDLTAHALAGTEVEATLHVEDDLGQRGQSGTLRFMLPAKPFSEPMAAAVAEQRRALVEAEALADAVRVRAVLESVTRRPEEYFAGIVPYLAIRVGTERLDGMLGRGISDPEYRATLALLWGAARRLEDGVMAGALDQLRAAIEALEAALARGADEAELARLNQALRQAVQEYLRAVQELARAEGAEPVEGMPLGARALEDMLRNFEGRAQLGQREEARRLLAQLRSMLENLRAGPSGPGGGAMQELGEILQEQTGLADRTMQYGGPQAGGVPAPDSGEAGENPGRGEAGLPQGRGGGTGGQASALQGLSRLQGALQQRLQALRESAFGSRSGGGAAQARGNAPGTIDRHLGAAEDAMRRAGGALGADDASGALPEQMAAIDALQAASREIYNAAEAAVLAGAGQGGTGPFGPDSGLFHPFGAVDLREAGGVRRARELFEEIRRRAGERARPQPERDYLGRLIDRF